MFVDFQNSYTVGRYLPTLCLWLDWHVFLAHSVLAHCIYFVLQQLISYILRLISDTIVSCLSSASRELRSGSNRTSPVESRSDAGCWSTCANWQRHKHSISDVAASVTSQHQWRRSISDVTASVTSQHQWRHSISDVAASVTSQHQWRRSISDVAASVTSQHQWRHRWKVQDAI